MTTLKLAQQAGYKNLAELSQLSGWPVRTLQTISKKHPKRWQTILKGANQSFKPSDEA